MSIEKNPGEEFSKIGRSIVVVGGGIGIGIDAGISDVPSTQQPKKEGTLLEEQKPSASTSNEPTYIQANIAKGMRWNG